jgi:hypothetical protein
LIYDPKIGRRWLILVAALAALMMFTVILVALDLITPWLLYTTLIWFMLGVGGAFLYGFKVLLNTVVPEPKTEDGKRYGIQRSFESDVVAKFEDRTQAEAIEIVLTVWGTVPTTLEEGGYVGEEWKLALGEGHWLVVCRTA